MRWSRMRSTRWRNWGPRSSTRSRASSLPFFKASLELFRYGLKASLNSYLTDHPRAGVHSLDELIVFNEENAIRVMPYFRQEFLEQAQTKGDLADEDYLRIEAELRRRGRSDGIDKALREHRLDAIVAPTEGSPPFAIDPVVGDNLLPGGCSTPPAVAGYPHISVPAGYLHGLPVGMSFFAGAFQEPNSLAMRTPLNRPPEYGSHRDTYPP